VYAVIRQYRLENRHNKEIDQKMRDAFTALIEKAPGFISFYWVNTEDGDGAAVSLFESKASAQAANHLAAKFVKEHLARLGMGAPLVLEGEVQAHTEKIPRSRAGEEKRASAPAPSP